MIRYLLSILSLFLFYSCLFAQKLKQVSPDNEFIEYTGRIDFSDKKNPQFSYPGVSIKASFEGTEIGFIINDFGEGDSAHANVFEVIVDDSLHQTVYLKSGKNKVLFESVIENKKHTIELFKRTESSVGTCSFSGFLTQNGSLISPIKLKLNRKIEFIGDSWTCGYGNMRADIKPKQGFNSQNENNYLAFGAITARNLKAQYVCTAYSGRGMYRNSSGYTHGTLPLIYDQIIPDNEKLIWNHQSYEPDLTVIDLGTNDFYPEAWAEPSALDSASYVLTYVAFVKKIKVLHPNTSVLLLFGNSKSDNWPVGKKHLTRWRNYMKAVFETLQNEGQKSIFLYELAVQKAPYGEDWHPSLHTHKSVANELTLYIAKVLNW